MGCTTIKKQQKPIEIKPDNITQQNRNPIDNKLKFDWTCPNCMMVIGSGSMLSKFQEHIQTCIIYSDQNIAHDMTEANYSVNSTKDNSAKVSNTRKNRKSILKEPQYIFEKREQQKGQNISYVWQKVPKSKTINSAITKSTIMQIKQMGFQQKQIWFREELEKLRISWEHGCHWVRIDKKNVLQSAISQFKKANLHKQIKVRFEQQSANDAGGLLRELVHLVIKQIFNQKTGLFLKAQTDQMIYKLKSKSINNKNINSQILYFYGQILGKSILQKISLHSYLDRTIIRQLCDQQLQISDVFSFDKNLYNSWNYILSTNLNKIAPQQADNPQFYYTIPQISQQNNKIYDHELVKNGKNIKITEQNKVQYIKQCINYTCSYKLSNQLNSIKKGLYSVVPSKLINIFQPKQIQMMLYGVPFIDIVDWQQNTEYVGAYHATHKNIVWLWQYIGTQPQQKLTKLLHFCTGSSRVPIHGFGKLQTNRGQKSKFVIQSRLYDKNDPYPKGHTCFNRLEIPVYPNKKLLQQYLGFILQANLQGVYGLD